MKRILVPTDFSDCAGFAADAAVRMAEQHGAEVIIYTRIPGDQSEGFKEAEDASALPMSIASKFRALVEPYADAGTVIRMMYSAKDLVPGILELADKEDAGLIVMGSSGAGGLKELVWGSNAQRMVNQSTRPVMVIKHPVEDVSFNDIVFASNFYREVKQPFEQLVEFAQIFGATMHLVHVTTKDTDAVEEFLAKKKMKAFEEQIGGRIPYSVHFFGDIDTRHGIEHFAIDNRYDLIALVSHGEGFFKKILKGGSVAESLVNRVEMPILTVRAMPIEETA